MKQKSSIAAKYLAFANNLTCRTGCLYQAELLNLHRLRFCLLLYRSFQWIFSCHENTALHRTTRSASEVAHLIRTTKGQLPLKILQIFFFQITCQDILFGAKLAQKSLCFGFLICLYCLSQYLSIKLKRLYRRFSRVSAVFYLLCAYTSIFTLYMPKILPYHGFFMQNTVSLYRFPLYRDIRKRCCVVFFFPWLKERLRLSLRAFCLGFRAFSA